MADLPEYERPREWILCGGPGGLTDAEVLVALLGTGKRGSPAIDTAWDILASYGDLTSLQRADAADLAGRRGLGPAKGGALAATLDLRRRARRPRGPRPLLRDAREVFDHGAPRVAHLAQEVFVALSLDVECPLLHEACAAAGGSPRSWCSRAAPEAPRARGRALVLFSAAAHQAGGVRRLHLRGHQGAGRAAQRDAALAPGQRGTMGVDR